MVVELYEEEVYGEEFVNGEGRGARMSYAWEMNVRRGGTELERA